MTIKASQMKLRICHIEVEIPRVPGFKRLKGDNFQWKYFPEHVCLTSQPIAFAAIAESCWAEHASTRRSPRVLKLATNNARAWAVVFLKLRQGIPFSASVETKRGTETRWRSLKEWKVDRQCKPAELEMRVFIGKPPKF